jgi:hypothetical protein
MRAVSIAVALSALTLFVASCSPSSSWTTATSPSAPVASGSGALSAVTFVIDSDANGSEYVLSTFDPATGELTFSGRKGLFRAVLDADTVFRDAQTAKYQPVDPCRALAENYNTAGTTSDEGGVFSAIQAMAAQGCHARILVEKNTVPPNLTRSFRPLPSF